ncbi:MAG TPA: hypothetical protein VLM40_08970, partial [Gemmata sp.]|nr:hypothetical protein [Gemmata sp.]
YMDTLPHDLDDENLPLYYADRLVQDAIEKPAGWRELAQYTDPVDREEYRGVWLAAIEPVIVRSDDDRPIDSGFLIVVQERQDQVLQPVAALQWRLGISATVAGLFLILVLAIVWAGTVSVLSGTPKSRVTRLLRRWAGLPAGTANSTATGGSLGSGSTPVSGSAIDELVREVKTARLGVAVTPGGGGDLGGGTPKAEDGTNTPPGTPRE